MFGDDVPASVKRCVVTGSQEIITGPTGRGWFLKMDKGSPKAFSFDVKQMTDRPYVFLSIPYPSTTTFTIQAFVGGKLFKTLTAASSAAEVRASDGTKYFFGGARVFVKVVNLDKTAAAKTFEVDGVHLPQYTGGVSYSFTASNCPTVATQGATQFCSHGDGGDLPTTIGVV